MSHPYVIIFATGLNGLGALRSSAAAGLKAYTLINKPSELCNYSRFSECSILLPPKPTLQDITPILDRIYIKEGGPGVLLACSDGAAELLGGLKRDGLSRHHLIVPSSNTTRILNDKKLECQIMKKGGIRLPKTYYQLAKDIPDSYPVIIKPRTFRDYRLLGSKNVLVHSRAELDAFCKKFDGQVERFIGQQVIPGDDSNLWVCNVTFDRNMKLSACFIFNRLGTMPSHYGVTSLAISRENEELRSTCAKIGVALNYCGPAMIEFKLDSGSNTYHYIETNPRLGMCNWFDTQCGVNNILACSRIAYNESVSFEPQLNDRIYWNFFGDLIARLENRESFTSITTLYFRLLLRHRIGALFYWKDPYPAFRYSCTSVKNICSRVLKKLRGEFS